MPLGRETRPTADRAREGLFSALDALLGGLHDARFLDLYAGSGAVGLEALSRGAAHALLVESDPRAARVITANLAALDLAGGELLVGRVEQLVGRRPARPAYDVVFADPPYATADDELRTVVRRAHQAGWLTPEAVVVVERPARGGVWQWPDEIVGERSRRYGEATLWYGLAAGTSSPAPVGRS